MILKQKTLELKNRRPDLSLQSLNNLRKTKPERKRKKIITIAAKIVAKIKGPKEDPPQSIKSAFWKLVNRKKEKKIESIWRET